MEHLGQFLACAASLPSLDAMRLAHEVAALSILIAKM